MHIARSMRTPGSTFLAALVLLFGARSPLDAAIGDPIGADFQVNAYSTGAQGEPAVAPDGAGGFVVVWHSDGSPSDDESFSVQARRYAAAGVPAGDEFQVNTYTPFPQLEPAVSPDGTGGFVVVWQSGGSSGTDTYATSVQGQRFSATGAPVGGEFQVNTYTTDDQVSPAVAPDGAGGFVVVWNSDGGSGTDTDGSSIQAQRFDATGAPAGGEFQVNTYTTNDQYDAVVSSDGGGFVVVWASDGGAGTDANFASIQAQRFDENGPVGTQFQVNSYTTSTQRLPAVTSLEGGGFVVAWQSDASSESDRSDRSVQAQRFGAAGTPVGGQFQVNTFTTSTQDAPSVGRDGGGGFVVIWESEGGIGSDPLTFSAQARRFDANGVPAGGEVQVNTYTPSVQRGFAVGPDGSGGFVVLWDSLGSSGSDNNAQSVQGRRFVGPGSPTTSTITTTTLAGPVTTSTTLRSGGAGGERLTGRKLKLRSKVGLPEKSRLAMRSKDRRLTLGRGNQSLDDPVLHGGALTVSSGAGGFGATQVLTGGWKYVGKLGRNKGYKWKSRSGPIRALVLKRGKGAKVVGRGGTLGFDLDNDPNPVRVSVRIGGHFYCFEFGGTKVRFKPNKRFAAKKAGAPTTCP